MVGQDRTHDRPSAVRALGVDGAMAHLRDHVEAAVEAVPACLGADDLRELVRLQATRLTPKNLARTAA